jgi:hypothetical protein
MGDLGEKNPRFSHLLFLCLGALVPDACPYATSLGWE